MERLVRHSEKGGVRVRVHVHVCDLSSFRTRPHVFPISSWQWRLFAPSVLRLMFLLSLLTSVRTRSARCATNSTMTMASVSCYRPLFRPFSGQRALRSREPICLPAPVAKWRHVLPGKMTNVPLAPAAKSAIKRQAGVSHARRGNSPSPTT